MNCPYCGAQMNPGARFCPVCGRDCASAQSQPYAQPQAQPYAQPQAQPYAQPYAQPSAPAEPAYYDDPGYAEYGTEPPKKSPLKAILIILIALFVVAAIGIGIYFVVNNASDGGSSSSDKDDKIECKECGDEFDGSGDYCDDCSEKLKDCVNCGDEFIGESEYCDDCEAKFKDCPECYTRFLGEGKFCSDCVDGLTHSECQYCETIITEENLAVIDDENYGFCHDCDTGNYCIECHAPAAHGESYCYWHGGSDID